MVDGYAVVVDERGVLNREEQGEVGAFLAVPGDVQQDKITGVFVDAVGDFVAGGHSELAGYVLAVRVLAGNFRGDWGSGALRVRTELRAAGAEKYERSDHQNKYSSDDNKFKFRALGRVHIFIPHSYVGHPN